MKINLFFKSVVFLLCAGVFAYAQNPTPTPKVVGEVTITSTKANSDPAYKEFRKASEAPSSFSGQYATVNNLVLKRDAATFTLRSGEMYFLAPAQGKTTGAVFFGDANFQAMMKDFIASHYKA